MSMMKTLARVAAGVMLAKGIGQMMQNQQRGQQQGRDSRTTGGGLLGDLLNPDARGGDPRNQGYRGSTGSAGQSGSQSGGQSGGLGDMLGQILGGGSAARPGTGRPYGGPNSQGASGGLGGILDQLTRSNTGGRSGSTAGGGFGDLLAGLGGGAAAGGLGGVLGDLLGNRQGRGGLAQKGAQPQNDATFGEVFNDALVHQGEPEVAPTPEQNAVAGLMLKAMIQAAKSDGRIDDAEKQRLLGQVGDLDDEERQFIREQMAAPVDPHALAREVPKGLEQQVYMMSLMAIDFDNEREAHYLHDLAEALGVTRAQANAIHQHVGVQNLYA